MATLIRSFTPFLLATLCGTVAVNDQCSRSEAPLLGSQGQSVNSVLPLEDETIFLQTTLGLNRATQHRVEDSNAQNSKVSLLSSRRDSTAELATNESNTGDWTKLIGEAGSATENVPTLPSPSVEDWTKYIDGAGRIAKRMAKELTEIPLLPDSMSDGPYLLVNYSGTSAVPELNAKAIALAPNNRDVVGLMATGPTHAPMGKDYYAQYVYGANNGPAESTDWKKYMGGTGSVGDYMSKYSGAPAAPDLNAKAAAPAPVAASAPVPAAVPAASGPTAAPDWGKWVYGANNGPAETTDWKKYMGGTGSVGDYMSKYSGAPAAPDLNAQAAAPAPIAVAAGPTATPDWTKWIGGTGSTADYMAKYSGTPSAPDLNAQPAAPAPIAVAGPTAVPDWTQWIGGTGSTDDYMAKYSGAPAAAPAPVATASGPNAAQDWTQWVGGTGDWHQWIGGTGSTDDYMAKYAR